MAKEGTVQEWTPEKPPAGKPKAPAKERKPEEFGVTANAYLADLLHKTVTVHLLDHTTLTGVLLGVDRYHLILELNGKKLLVPKHAILFME